ncbi:Transient receptor putative cation channel sub V member 5 [Podochytrium sp. JEL0797]|nr:Transient receptor putative cation channel sub V member 5 [Podochytrium sp. JEL0797]
MDHVPPLHPPHPPHPLHQAHPHHGKVAPMVANILKPISSDKAHHHGHDLRVKLANSGKGALTDQSSGFFQTPTCKAITVGDLEEVKLLMLSDKDLICERGPFGETHLHVAILKKQPEIAFWLVKQFAEDTIAIIQDANLTTKDVLWIDVAHGTGLKLDFTNYGNQYMGETPLHQACKNGMVEVVKALLEAKADVNAEVTGVAFQDLSSLNTLKYPNLYCGSTPLHFAASRRESLEIIKLLVENGANLYAKDVYGNNVLHILAYFGLYGDSFAYIVNQNEKDLISHKNRFLTSLTEKKLILQENKHNQIAAKLGLSFGHASLMEALKEPQWEFGEDICYYGVPLDDICPILHHQGDGYSKPLLAEIVESWDHEMVNHPIIRAIVKVKWDTYARRYFLRKLLWSLVTVICFTISLGLDSGQKSSPTQEIINAQFGLMVVSFVLTVAGIIDILQDYVRLYRRTHFLPRHLREVKQPFWKTVETRCDFVWVMVKGDIDAEFIRFTFYVCVVLSFALGLAGRVLVIDFSQLPRIQAVGALFGWMHIMYYSRGMKTVGPLLLVLRKMITKGFARWVVIYVTIEIGFSTAFYTILKRTDYVALGLDVPEDWNYYSGAVLWTIRFLFVMDDFEMMRKEAGNFVVILFLVHQFTIIIILLNVLIALLVDVFNAISKEYESQWLLQMARICCDVDRDLTPGDRKVLEDHFGFHQNPEVKVKQRARARGSIKPTGRGSILSIHPREMESQNLETGSHAQSLEFPKINETYSPSTESIHAGDKRHFFMFLDQSKEMEVEGVKKTVLDTVRLVTGVYKYDGLPDEDVEFVMDEKWWSFKKVVMDLRRLFSPQSDDIWHSVGKDV